MKNKGLLCASLLLNDMIYNKFIKAFTFAALNTEQVSAAKEVICFSFRVCLHESSVGPPRGVFHMPPVDTSTENLRKEETLLTEE